jgi:branched-chain amino acid transport system permease protein
MRDLLRRFRAFLGRAPLLAYLLGFLLAVVIEGQVGRDFAMLIGLEDVPAFMGITDSLGELQLDKGFVALLASFPNMFLFIVYALVYDIVIYGLATVVVGQLLAAPLRWLLARMPPRLSWAIHGLTLFLGLWIWGGLIQYRMLVVMYIGVNIIMCASLNLINGYMGEFSCGHAGFMAVGAYVSSVLTVWLFSSDSIFGPPVMTPGPSLLLFPLILIAGGFAAALAGLLVAFPSFKTRGDYLAIVTISVNFIIKSAIENMEFIGGPRGFMGMKQVIKGMESVFNAPWMLIWTFIFTIVTLAVIHNIVSSTKGKGIVAIREDEIAAELMSVNTRRTKIIAFMVSSFFAGIAGGLFAHILGYINPGVFTIVKSTESLVMVYLGGMGSLTGSVLSAGAFTLGMEVLRPLEVWKKVLIWLLLIILMQYRREGIMGGKEIGDFISLEKLGLPQPKKEELSYAPASD